MNAGFDADALLAALTGAMAELCQKLGKGDHTIRRALQKVAAMGNLGTSQKRITSIDGGWSWSPTYYMKP
jgi:DNA-binding FadR family transcriptional regulator